MLHIVAKGGAHRRERTERNPSRPGGQGGRAAATPATASRDERRSSAARYKAATAAMSGPYFFANSTPSFAAWSKASQGSDCNSMRNPGP